MSNGRTLVRILLLVVAGASLVALALDLQKKRQVADAAAQGIEDKLAELDPVTRAAVVAKLAAGAAEHVQEARHGNA